MATAGLRLIAANGDAAAPLPVAAIVTRKLTDASVRFGVYKNVASIPLMLAGLSDLDLLIDARDIRQVRDILTSLKGVCGLPSRFHDNRNSGREDWFIPDDGGGFLHLDLAVDLCVGPKFRKRYRALKFDDISDWRFFTWPEGSLPMVSPMEEARIALLNSAFSIRRRPAEQWVELDPSLASVLRAAIFQSTAEYGLQYDIGANQIVCRARQSRGTVEGESASLQRLRRAVRSSANTGPFPGLSDWLVHHIRRSSYSIARWLTRSDPGRTATRRSLLPTGMVVAVVGPDGAGKSTQTQRLSEILQRNFRCRTLYLGSNNGGFLIRRLVGRYRNARKLRLGPLDSVVAKASLHRSSTRDMASAAWRLIVALRRYLAVRKAMRLAASGAIVISDRWPQNLEPGILDGPSVPRSNASGLKLLIDRLERNLYHKMEPFKPSLTIHLITDFETSLLRKPGEICRSAIERRLALMQRMRDRDPQIMVVDSRQSMDDVTISLLQTTWFALWTRSASPGQRANSPPDATRRAQPVASTI